MILYEKNSPNKLPDSFFIQIYSSFPETSRIWYKYKKYEDSVDNYVFAILEHFSGDEMPTFSFIYGNGNSCETFSVASETESAFLKVPLKDLLLSIEVIFPEWWSAEIKHFIENCKKLNEY